MIHNISNSHLSIVVDEQGAELKSLVKVSDQCQLLWQGDSQYWDEHSPILFPTVGSSYGQTIRHHGQAYPMPKHGLVKGMHFTLTEKREDSLTFTVGSNEQTLQHYPFQFSLSVRYTLRDKQLQVSFLVTNKTEESMPFIVGGHPGFALPNFRSEDAIHGYLYFAGRDKLTSLGLKPGGYAWREGAFPVALDKGLLALTNETFTCDTILDATSALSECTLLDKEKAPLLTVRFTSPVLALWAPRGGCAPFVCIEPWWGLCDEDGYQGEFSQRPFINKVNPGSTHELNYSVEVY